MASQNTLSVLNKICNTVEKIAAATGAKGGKKSAGAALKSASAGSILSAKDAGKNLKDIGAGVKDIASGLLKFRIAQKAADGFAKFIDSLADPLKKFSDKDTREGISVLTALFKALGDLKPLKIIGLSLAFLVFTPVFALFGLALHAFPAKKTKEVAGALANIGDAFKGVGIGIALLTLTFVLSALALDHMNITGGVIGLLGGLGTALVALYVTTKTGALTAFKDIGNAMISLAGGIALFSLVFLLSSLAFTGVAAMAGLPSPFSEIAGGIMGGVAPLALLAGTGWVIGKVFNDDSVQKGLASFKDMSKGILFLGAGLGLFSLVFLLSAVGFIAISKAAGLPSPFAEIVGGILGGVAPLALLWGTGKVISTFGNKKVSKGARAINTIGNSIIYLAAGIGLFTLVFLLAAVGMAAVVNMSGASGNLGAGLAIVGALIGVAAPLGLLYGTGWVVGKAFGNKKVIKGATAMQMLAPALTELAKGIGVLSAATVAAMAAGGAGGNLMIGGFNVGAILGLIAPVGMLLGVGLASKVYGAQSVTGAAGIGAIGAALIPFGFGLTYFGTALKDLDIEQMIAIPTLIAAIGAEAALAGAAAVVLLPGAAAIAAVGGALIPFGMGVESAVKGGLNETTGSAVGAGMGSFIKEFWDKIKVKAVLGLAGLTLPLLAVGNAMGSLAKALTSAYIATKDIDDVDAFGEKFGKALNGVIEPMSKIELPPTVPMTVTFVGKALSSLASGVGAWAVLENIPLIDHFEDGKPVFGKTANVSDAINNIKEFLRPDGDFSIIGVLGKFAQDNKDLFTGNGDNFKTSSSPFVRSMFGLQTVAFALSGLAMGVASWAKLNNIPIAERFDKDGKPIFGKKPVNIETAIKNIKDFLRPEGEFSIIGTFAEFAEKNKELFVDDSGLFKKASNPFVRAMGGIHMISFALTSLAMGVTSWAKMQGIPLISSYDKNGKPIYTGKVANVGQAIQNIKDFLSPDGKVSIIQAFADFAEKNKDLFADDTHFWQKSSSPFVRGISGVYTIGQALSSLGTGIGAWMKLEGIKEIVKYDKNGKPVFGKSFTILQAINNVRTVLSLDGEKSIVKVFSDLGRQLFFTESFFSYGLNHSYRIGTSLTMISNAINEFAKSGVLESSKKLQEAMQPLFDTFGKSDDPKKPSKADGTLANINALVSSIKEFNSQQKQFKKSVDIFEDFEDVFEDIADDIDDVDKDVWQTIKDLTIALNKFTEGDHTENLLKSAVALQAALTTPAGESKGNADVEKANAEVEAKGMTLPGKDKDKQSAEKSREGSDPLAKLTATMDAIQQKLDSIESIMNAGYGMKVYVTNNPMEN